MTVLTASYVGVGSCPLCGAPLRGVVTDHYENLRRVATEITLDVYEVAAHNRALHPTGAVSGRT